MTSTRDPSSVPVQRVLETRDLETFAGVLDSAVNVAIDTETPIDGPARGKLRVASVATRDATGSERCFVVDARDFDVTRLAACLSGVVADAWNANFDARVLDSAIWKTDDVTTPLRWWDAQLADALLHQGRTGFGWYHGLAWATEHYLGITVDGKGTTQLSYTATDDLTPDQVRYAAADAVETLWVSDVLRDRIARAGLETICEIEMAARPFLDRMERSGLPFDWPGWQRELDELGTAHRATLGRLSDLTGGGQGTLFDDIVEPSWNPASDTQVRTALNRWATAEVARWTQTRFGASRSLTDRDSVTASVLREIGGPLCDALLDFRSNAKILGTYGDSIRDHLHEDGRLRPQYLQVVGTNTGRLASRNPNAQNLTPLMKPYVRPPNPERVFVYADLSQAELRFLAQVADDEALRSAFDRGEDVHITTAATMFGIDVESLANSDPSRHKQLRQIAKALNFGIAYGSGASALARSLTANGTPTSLDEGAALLERYRATYPGTTRWARERVAEIERIAQRARRIDWPLSLRLARSFPAIRAIQRDLRRSQHRWPTAEEVIDAAEGLTAPPGQSMLEHVSWVMEFSGPVALVSANEALTFASRTIAGRRQQFNLHLDRVLLTAIGEIVRSGDRAMVAARSRFEQQHQVSFGSRASDLGDDELADLFDDRALRRHFIDVVVSTAGFEAAEVYLTRAATERIRAMANAWRNAPIQGGVADIMLDAYARIHASLADIASARPVQTVHDSVVVECDLVDAERVAAVVRAALDAASRRFCPDVTPHADIDVRRSLADDDVIADALRG